MNGLPFALFSFPNQPGIGNHPQGGWNDYVGSFATVVEAVTVARDRRRRTADDAWQVVDLTTCTIVESGEHHRW